VKALCRRGGEFAKAAARPSMSGGPWSRSAPGPPPNPRRAVLAIGSASSSAALGPPRKSRRAVSGSGQPCSSSWR